MENFNYQLHGRNENDCLEQLEFNCGNNFIRSDFTSSDVERVLMEAHESILGTIEPIGTCQDANTFLNPMNDILGDISELNKNFCVANTVCPQNTTHAAANALSALNCSWPMADTSSYIGVSSASAPENITADSGFFNMSGGNNSQLLLPESTSDYVNTDCSFLSSDYASSFNNLFHSFEQQQQFSLLSNPISAIQHPSTNQNFSDAFLNTIGSLPASTTITPITVEERQIGHRTLSPVQEEVTIEARFCSEKASKRHLSDSENFAPSQEHSSAQLMPVPHFASHHYDGAQGCVGKRKMVLGQEAAHQMGTLQTQHGKGVTAFNQNQSSQIVAPPACGSASNPNLFMVPQNNTPSSENKASATISKRFPVFPTNRFNWTAVFPRKHLINPPEMIIMHPLRTRKLMSSRRGATSAGTALDLSEYFDTSSINIPMIRERPRAEGKHENRRKQKLNIIPGAENFVFEIQTNEEYGPIEISTVTDNDNWGSERDPYPETELPELEEIFRRKKKNMVSAPTAKRSHIVSSVVSRSPQKKPCIGGVLTNAPSNQIQESSASFEEKVSLSISIRQGRSKISIDTSSETDSIGSADGIALSAKSLKCIKCMKLFKSTRSLAIHTKRCTAIPRATCPAQEGDLNIEIQSFLAVSKSDSKLDKNDEAVESFIEDGRRLVDNGDNYDEDPKRKLIDASGELKARPITRSQTKKKSSTLSQKRGSSAGGRVAVSANTKCAK